MELKKIHIENFRSIKELNFEIESVSDRHCQIMFGVNETGKSSILKAIRLLDKNAKVIYEHDCEKSAIKQSKSIKLEYYFSVNRTELLQHIKNDFLKKIVENFSLREIVKIVEFNDKSQRTENYRVVGLLSNNDDAKRILFNNEDILKYVNSIKKMDLLTSNEKNYLEEIMTTQLSPILEEILLPKIIFWEASDAYLINQPINLASFKNNPSLSIPLKNIFLLIDIEGENLIKEIDRISKNTEEREELEESLSEAATKHLNSLWPEHKIKIHVRIEKDGYCEVSVCDIDSSKEKFRMEQRSDGFKQFVSILLTLSVENKKEKLKDKIILLDEPERSLHPSSITYLKDELLNISKNNIVLIASHSIFMVDKKNLNRHIIVRKTNNKTQISRVSKDNAFEDEVIYESLGTSIFELIQPYVVIFEGSTDKQIFDAFSAKFEADLMPEKINTICASGSNEIKKYVKFFNQKIITGIVLVDSDKAGRSEKRSILSDNRLFKNTTFEITDLINLGKEEATLEDILPENIILEEASKIYKKNISGFNNKSSIINQIKNFKSKNSIMEDLDLSELKRKIKDRVLFDLSTNSVSDIKRNYANYYLFVKEFHLKIKNIQKNVFDL